MEKNVENPLSIKSLEELGEIADVTVYERTPYKKTFKQHIPNFVSGVEPVFKEINDVKEIFDIDSVKAFADEKGWKLLVPCSEVEWSVDNGSYAPHL